ncbi:CGG triplet repeat-binding protein 1-like, partial [Daktulosphaira vitifoliae]|uniref:CGG triplet repeat-binding protein 1-like n=1 Tax=Daktulosphaira vitifoliae TaxID=58002 RepID=UPI0021AABCCD
MPKTPPSKLKNLIAQWILPLNKDNVNFKIDGTTLFCQLCDKHIPCIKKSQIIQHVNTSSHQEALKRKSNNPKQLFLPESTSKKNVNELYEDLCLSLIVANIPWYKLQNPQFRAFLEKYTGKHIPDE